MRRLIPRLGTIRIRITAIATIVVAAVLALVALALVFLVRRELFHNLDNSLAQRADTYQASLAEEGNEAFSTLLNSNDEDRAAQLVGADGIVLAATPNLVNAEPLTDTMGTRTFDELVIVGLEDDSFRILSRPVSARDGPAVLHVAQNVDDLKDTVRNLGLALTAAVPSVVVALAVLVWWLVGRTLRPVELIRAEVADISGTDLQRRLPVPAQADEIARLATTMNQLLDRIDAAGRRQRQFLADASHELRTPLTRIRTEIEVDQDQPALADSAATNNSVLEETITLQELLDDLLFLARSDERQHHQKEEPLDLDTIVLSEVQHQRHANPDVDINTTSISAAPTIGDPGQLARVVRNLLSNAARHAETSVAVDLHQSNGTTHLSVTDDGPGVPPDARIRIFERFGRADDARARVHGGAGLGLSIARDIVERHDGQIVYDDAWTDGARFVVTLPDPESQPASSIA